SASCQTTGWGFLSFVVVGLVYMTFMWTTSATLGQRALGIRVLDATTGGSISLGRSLLRYVGLVLSAIPLGLGLMWAGWDPRKQGWHDKLANTVVLRR
ncbi:MAG: RDD family protein, partial [Candidatus Dormibacteria bacterium]